MENSMDTWLHSVLTREWKRHAEEIGRVNVAVFGKTGVGKSTLVNAVFGEEIAATGTGEPVTQKSQLYYRENGPLGLLDTRGVEIGPDSARIIRDLTDLVKRRRGTKAVDHIHVAWYCVLADGGRFEPAEAQFVRDVAALGIPVIVVITQTARRGVRLSPRAVELADSIDALNLPIEGSPLLVMAAPDDFADTPSHGLPELLEATFRAVPEAVREALTAAQRIDPERKRKQSVTVIKASAAAAGSAALTPIPMSDAAMIVPVQLGMVVRISMIWGISLERTTLAAMAATSGATVTGRSLVGNLAKLVPGFGSVAGGAINATVASTITWAMGQSWLHICELITSGSLSPEVLKDKKELRRIFTREFKKYVSRRGDSAA